MARFFIKKSQNMNKFTSHCLARLKRKTSSFSSAYNLMCASEHDFEGEITGQMWAETYIFLDENTFKSPLNRVHTIP